MDVIVICIAIVCIVDTICDYKKAKYEYEHEHAETTKKDNSSSKEE